MFSVQDQKSYSFKLNKKLKVLARKSALTYKAKEDSILVLDDLSFNTPKTKDFISVLKNLKIDGDKSLFVTSEKDQNTFLSSRNLKNAKVITADKLNTYDILDSHKLLFQKMLLIKLKNYLRYKYGKYYYKTHINRKNG